jgi:gluconate 5-dehydrogenase
MQLNEKIVLVTGIGGGIGEAILIDLAPKVKAIITSSRTQKEKLSISQKLSNWEHLDYDLTKKENVESLFRHIKMKYGKLDAIINTIGGSLYSHSIETFPLDQFQEVLNVNLTSAFLLTQFAIKTLRENDSQVGHIVHFVSSSTKKFSYHKAPYGIAKAGLARLIQFAAAENGQFNIKVNGISPTYVFTPRHEAELELKAKKQGISKKELVDKILRDQLLSKPLYPQDLVPLVEYLITTDIVTGQIYDATLGEVTDF